MLNLILLLMDLLSLLIIIPMSLLVPSRYPMEVPLLPPLIYYYSIPITIKVLSLLMLITSFMKPFFTILSSLARTCNLSILEVSVLTLLSSTSVRITSTLLNSLLSSTISLLLPLVIFLSLLPTVTSLFPPWIALPTNLITMLLSPLVVSSILLQLVLLLIAPSLLTLPSLLSLLLMPFKKSLKVPELSKQELLS